MENNTTSTGIESTPADTFMNDSSILAGPDVLLDFRATLDRYMRYGSDAANRFDGHVFRKAIRTPGGLRLATLRRADDGRVHLILYPDGGDSAVRRSSEAIAGKLLGLSFPLEAFYAFAATDAVMSRAITAFPGLRPTLTADPFEMLVGSITAQQINLPFAFATRRRLVQAFGETIERQGDKYHAFPTADALAAADQGMLREMQFSNRKAEYIVNLARSVCDGEIDLDKLAYENDETVIERLTALTGIGRWTADWFMARHLGRGHAAAVGDLAVRKAMKRFYFREEETPNESDLRVLAARWGDYANLAVHYLLSLHASEKQRPTSGKKSA